MNLRIEGGPRDVAVYLDGMKLSDVTGFNLSSAFDEFMELEIRLKVKMETPEEGTSHRWVNVAT